MEFRFEQLFIVLLIVLFSLADLFIRWMRKKHGQAPPTGIEEEAASIEEEEPARALPKRAPTSLATPVVLPTPPAPPSRLAASPKPPAPTREAVRGRGWLTPGDARRGIVLMTVLGPCRGLEPRGS